MVDKNNLLNPIESLYNDSLSEHGASPQGVGWKSIHEQQMRFEKLAELIDTENDFTVADYGCGYAAMFNFLNERFGSRLLEYHGYDICHRMIEQARGVVRDKRARFWVSDKIIRPVDYVFVSGTYNVKLETPVSEWEHYVKKNIKELTRCASRGVAYNLFTTRVDYREPQLYYANPSDYLDFAINEISPNVQLQHHYPLYEWTMLIYL